MTDPQNDPYAAVARTLAQLAISDDQRLRLLFILEVLQQREQRDAREKDRARQADPAVAVRFVEVGDFLTDMDASKFLAELESTDSNGDRGVKFTLSLSRGQAFADQIAKNGTPKQRERLKRAAGYAVQIPRGARKKSQKVAADVRKRLADHSAELYRAVQPHFGRADQGLEQRERALRKAIGTFAKKNAVQLTRQQVADWATRLADPSPQRPVRIVTKLIADLNHVRDVDVTGARAEHRIRLSTRGRYKLNQGD